MSKIPNSTEPVTLRSRWPRRTAVALVVFVVLLVCTYFVATSAPFFKRVILPRLGRAICAELTVADVSISPFKRVVLRELKVKPFGQEQLLTASEVRVQYSLLDIMRGNVTVDELAIELPVLTVAQNADGTSNLDPIQTALAKKGAPPTERKPAKPTRLDIKKIALNNGSVRYISRAKFGGENLVALTNLTVAISAIKNGQTGQLKLSGEVNIVQSPTSTGGAGALSGKLLGEFRFGLLADARPGTVTGTLHLETTTATGALCDFAPMRAELTCDVSPSEIREVGLRFFKAGAQLGQIRVSGPFDMEKIAGDLAVEILQLDKQVLNMAGVTAGLDFGTTTINSTNRLQITNTAVAVSLSGQLVAHRMTVSRGGQSTPAIELRAQYKLTVDRQAGLVEFTELGVTGTQNGRALLEVRLAQPMTIAFGAASGASPESALELRVDKLDLADWRPFLGQLAPSGRVDLQARVACEQGGQMLRFDLGANASGLELLLGTNRVSGLDASVETHGQTKALNQITLSKLRAQVAFRGHEIFTLTGTGNFDIGEQLGDAQLRLAGAMPAVATVLGSGDVSVSGGTFALETRFSQKMQTQQLAGSLQLDSVAGRAGQTAFSDLDATAEFNLAHQAGQFEVKTVKCTVFQAGKPCGAIELTGRYNSHPRSGDMALQLTGLTERALAPVLEPMLKETKLVSVTLNCTASAKLDAVGSGTAKADLLVSNLVVTGPQGKTPATPLEARLLVDSLIRTQLVELRQCQLVLSPTTRAKNRLDMTGSVDFSKPDAISGRLQLGADTLDFTPYYDAFVGDRAQKQPEPVAPPPAGAQKEPEAMKLPVDSLDVEVALGKLYLREVELENLQARAQIRSGRILVDPVRFALNGGAVDAKVDLDLSVPGYRYSATLSAAGVPIAPLANSFSVDYRNHATGSLCAKADVKGAGITGATLQQTLTGSAAITLTNANVQLVGRKAKLLITPIALVLGLDELAHAAVNGLDAELVIGNGVIKLVQGKVSSDLFIAQTGGEIQIAPVLSESRINDWPINLALRRSLAQKARLIAPDAQPEAAFINLPVFARAGGTVAEPKVNPDRLVIAGLVAKSAAGIPGLVGDKAGAILQGVGGLLSGQISGGTGQSTNQPATNAVPEKPLLPFNPLDLLRKR